jgi:RHS repeat-associated protein
VSYAYDPAKRLTNVTSTAGAFGYAYDSVCQMLPATITLPNGATISDSYDSVARLLSTALKSSAPATLNSHGYAYNLAGQRIWETNTLGDYRAYTYDNAGQLKSALGNDKTNATPRWQEQLGYAYDAAGNLSFRTNYALLDAFVVNSLNELSNSVPSGTLTVAGTTTSPATNVTVWGSSGLASGAATLYVDSTWARTNATLPGGSVTYTATAADSYGRKSTNSVTVTLPSTNSYTYDLNGNLLGDGTRGFAYNDENELISVWVTNVWRSDFVYDGKLRRRERIEYVWTAGAWATNGITYYVYDRNLVIQERNASNLPTVTYTRGRDLSGTFEGAGGIGGLLARSDNTVLTTQPSAAHAFYHADANGDITCLINSQQAIMARYLYDAYGRLLSQSGPLAQANLYRFSSKEFHVNSGLCYYLYRLYDPTLQRWLNRDPLAEPGHEGLRHGRSSVHGAGPNLYAFVDNNPAESIDAFGMGGLNYLGSRIYQQMKCEQQGGIWASPTQQEFGGNSGACVNNCMTARMYEASVLGGFLGGVVAIAGKAGVWGTLISTTIGAVLPYAYCETHCSDEQCYPDNPVDD